MLAVTAVGLAACGSSSKGASSTTTAAPTSQTTAAAATTAPATTASGGATPAGSATTATPAAPSGTPFVIGSSTPDTGQGNLKAVGDGLAAFVAYANADGGGFGGHPGQLKRCDYANDPQKASDCARQIADDASIAVAMSTGRYASTAVSTLGSATPPVPYVCPGVNNAAEGNSANTYCLYAGSPAGTYAALTYFASQGLKKGYFFTADSDAGHGTAQFTTTFAQGLGQTIEAAFFPTAQADFLPVAQAALAAKPDFIMIGAAPAQELAIFQAFKTLGSTTPIGTWSGLVPQSSIDQLKDAKFYVSMDALTPSASSSNDPEIALYRKWMQSQSYSDEIGDLSLDAWLVGRAMQSAANQSKNELSRTAIMNVLRQGELTVPLLKNPVSLKNAPTKTPGYSSVANPTTGIALVKNGAKQFLDQTATIP
jgi:branched-chain amino acid transport system substrate-binding protein